MVYKTRGTGSVDLKLTAGSRYARLPAYHVPERERSEADLVVLVQIERMQREDLPRVMEIERKCFATPWHESAYLTEMTNRSAYYVVARINGEIVGYTGMWVIMDESHITTLGVDPEHRGKKIGEQLLIALLDEAQRRHARRATLEVRETNHVAQNLYRKYGFVPAAIRRGYYTDNGENAIVMWVDDMLSIEYQKLYRQLKLELMENSEQEYSPA